MKAKKNCSIEVDAYIVAFPKNTQIALQQIRRAIIKAAPQAEEIISYKMPAYKYFGMLVYFAGYDKHVGFYPKPSGIEKFKNEISGFKWAKGSVQFPLDKPMPLKLVEAIVQFRLKENNEKSVIKKK